ncbi:GTPase IMAP family member 8-like isoform X2 [Triplophysa rosa]|uniref:GTPase IMAP family member 8-like isoform X2 n=1 Tax=Triplophysa rosa TaxID=992332 RepID=UPI002545FA03|nr:GTPase IMAP family member 8-like isoform X2 [Triplophysa rosa]
MAHASHLLVDSLNELLKDQMKTFRWHLRTDYVRIVLLGEDAYAINRVGNFLLGSSVFESEFSPDYRSERVRGKHMTLINCPHLLQPNLSPRHITQTLRECVYLSDPGPLAIMLIFKHDDERSREDQERVEMILNSFSDSVYEHVLVMTTHDSNRGHQTVNKNIQQCIEKCLNRHFRLETNSSLAELMEKLQSIIQMNSRRYLICEQSLTMMKQAEERDVVKLNVVVCGSETSLRDRRLKSSILKLMLKEGSRRSDCVMKIEMEVCGRLINLLELPALFNTSVSDEELMRQSLCCLSLCHPGVHVFLLIGPHHPLTDDRKVEMEEMHRIFSSRIKNHIMILIMQESEHTTAELDEVTQSVIKHYAERFHFFNPNARVSTLLERIEQMVEDNSGASFTTQTFLDERMKKMMKSKEMKRKIQPPENTDAVRIVLLGKTGVGKIATGNTILGREAFISDISQELVTKECQKETAEFNNRFITVIDTPGLFDTELSHEEIQREMINCISMILPGPHVFLLMVPLGRFTKEEATSVKIIQEMFGQTSRMYIMVLFTRGDNLKKKSIEECLGNPGSPLRNLVEECGNRYHVFNNIETEDRTQVSVLLEKIDHMVTANGGSYFSLNMFRDMEREKQNQLMKILIDRIEELIRDREEERERIKIMKEEETENDRVGRCSLS